MSIDLLQDQVEQAIARSSTYLFSVQRPSGSWQDHISPSVVTTSLVLCTLYHADHQRFAATLQRGCVWLREMQHENGSWGDSASTLNATSLAIAALKLIDPENSVAIIEHALAYIDVRGGFAAVANPKECVMAPVCLTLLALAGLYSWKKMARMPFAFILLPRRIWRGLSVTLPGIFAFGLIHDCKHAASPPRRWLSRLVRPKVVEWIMSTRGVNGSWQDCPMCTAMTLLGLVISGVPDEQAAPSLSYLLATQREDGSWPLVENLEPSVTLCILGAFGDVGLLDDPRLETARDWLLACYHDEPFAPTDCPGAWWSWTVPSGWPDIDDTAGAITVLRHLGLSANHPYMRKGCDWLCKAQNRNGSWNTFVKGAHMLMDEPCPAVTARAVLALHNCDEAPEQVRYLSAIERALNYFQQVQRSDGALHAYWFSHIYGTAQVLDVYATLNRTSDAVARKARTWLLEHQRADGSWSGDAEQSGTVEETAWALAALAAPGVDAPYEALDRAATWLLQQQHSEGSWSPSIVYYYGVVEHYSSDHGTNGFALQALGRYHCLRTQKRA